MKMNNEIRKYLVGVKLTRKGKEFDFEFNDAYGAHVIENNGIFQIRLKDKEYKTYYEILGCYDENKINDILLHQIKNRRAKK